MCEVYDPPRVWRAEWRTARKRHRCTECHRVIEPGERYEVSAGLSDGGWYGAKTCEHCRAAEQWLIDVCNGFLISDVLDELSDHADGGWVWSLAVLVAMGNRQWVRRDGKRVPVKRVQSLVRYAVREYMAKAA